MNTTTRYTPSPEPLHSLTPHVPVIPLDDRRVALQGDGNLYVHPAVAEDVSTAYQEGIGIALWADLADLTQGLRDDACAMQLPWGKPLEQYIGDGSYLGERWLIFAHITRGTAIRYIGYAADGTGANSPVWGNAGVTL